MKTYNFCSDACSRKNICNQIIKSIFDGNTVEDFLQQKDLTLDRAIQICQTQEAAKRQCAFQSTGQESTAT